MSYDVEPSLLNCHLSVVSLYLRNESVPALPLSTNIKASPPPAAPLLNVMLLSSTNKSVCVAEFIFAVTFKFPWTSKSDVNVFAPPMLCVPDVLTTEVSTSITPLDKSMPSPPLKCALTSAALGPVTVNTPVDALYVKLPSPLAKLALNNPLI